MRFSAWFLLLVGCFSNAREPLRTWMSVDGRTLEARYLETVGESVRIENTQGRKFILPLNTLSKSDQAYIQAEVTRRIEQKKIEESFMLPGALAGRGAVVVTDIQGDVQVSHNPAGDRFSHVDRYSKQTPSQEIKVGESIDMGVGIVTGKDAQVSLLFTNGTIANLGANSKVSFENLWQNPIPNTNEKVIDLKEEPSQSRTALKLYEGELILEVKKLKKDSSFLIMTDSVQAGIRGTKFLLKAATSQSVLSVTEGVVEYLDSNRKFFSVKKGERVMTNADNFSKAGKVKKNEKKRIDKILKEASVSTKNYDLKELATRSQKASRQQKTIVVKGAKNMELIWCPPGRFIMGPYSGFDSPAHTVLLTKGFYLGRYEVTQEQYEAVMQPRKNPSKYVGNKLPVESISWNDAKRFCDQLNRMEKNNIPDGWAFSLPTEAEWEYACRAGTTTDFSWGDEYDPDKGNFWNSRIRKTTKVGNYRSNPWGFFDMHGNVSEFCSDWLASYPDALAVDPDGSGIRHRTNTGGTWYYYRVLKGGNYSDQKFRVISASRSGLDASAQRSFAGFRLAFKPL